MVSQKVKKSIHCHSVPDRGPGWRPTGYVAIQKKELICACHAGLDPASSGLENWKSNGFRVKPGMTKRLICVVLPITAQSGKPGSSHFVSYWTPGTESSPAQASPEWRYWDFAALQYSEGKHIKRQGIAIGDRISFFNRLRFKLEWVIMPGRMKWKKAGYL